MPSFFLTSSSQVARTLLPGETGFIAGTGTLFTPAADAVTMNGSARLMVEGTLASDLSAALRIQNTTDVATVTVGLGGSILSMGSRAIQGVVKDAFHLNNAGTIQSIDEAIMLTAPSQVGVVPDFHITNSGRIQSTSATSLEATVELNLSFGGIVNLANTGLIVNGGEGHVLVIDGARLDLTNSGTIQCRSARTAIATTDGNDVIENTGTIIGGIILSNGNDTVTNHGTVSGNLLLGNGSDRLVNTGTITGAVNLSDNFTSGALTDTVINAGLIVGDVSLGNGNDVFRSRGGNVEGTVYGGKGDDLYVVDQSDLTIDDSSGNDTVRTSVNFTLATGLEILEVVGSVGRIGTGNQGANTLEGGGGNDTLRGGGGADMLSGGAGDGDDLLYGGEGDDLLLSTGGDDTLAGGGGRDTAILNAASATVGWIVNLGAGTAVLGDGRTVTLRSIESVEGDFGNDTMTGNAVANLLIGRGGSDRLNGGGGEDTLIGGDSADTLTGGSGADVFRFEVLDDSNPFAADRITDFVEGVDHIGLPIGPSYVFIGTDAFSEKADEVRYFTSGNTTTIEVRLAGSSSNAMQIDLTGIHVLTIDDFVL